jgi:hypothetical protein
MYNSRDALALQRVRASFGKGFNKFKKYIDILLK